MKKVLINVNFKDRYTGKTHIAGHTENMSIERVNEIKEVNPHFISVIGNVEEAIVLPDEDETEDTASDEGKKSAKKSGNKAK